MIDSNIPKFDNFVPQDVMELSQRRIKYENSKDNSIHKNIEHAWIMNIDELQFVSIAYSYISIQPVSK